MSLNKLQLDKLNKNEIIDYAMQLQEKYNDNLGIAEQLQQALVEINNIKASVEKLNERNIQLESTLLVTKNVNDQLVKRIESLERQVNANSQYSRCDCLEISGIPDSVENDSLESKVCEIFLSINVNVVPHDIQACHRLKNNRTIVKFVNRKGCISVLKNRKLLQDVDMKSLNLSENEKLYVNESLCPNYRYLFWKCRLLHKSNHIFSYWTFNGTIKIRLVDQGKIHAITHIKDLEKLFPDEDFNVKDE